MVRIFVQQIINGWQAQADTVKRECVQGHATREAAVADLKRNFPEGTEFEIQDMILGIPVDDQPVPMEDRIEPRFDRDIDD
jgi:hypothetical protein